VPEALDRIVRRAMQKDAGARYHSGDEFADDLVRALRNASGPARRDSLGDADKFAALRVLGFFKRFAEAELWEVMRIGQWQRVAAGTEIVREGEPGDFFCVLLEGEARVTKNGKLISVLGPGECFGEMAYLSAERRERGATVTAARDAHIVRVPTAELERASVGCRAHFDRAFVSILVERLNRANMRLTSA
jgi:CRP-like cAMP-binding protein